MKIRTVEQLSDFLSSEIVWRKKELSTLRSLILGAKGTADRQSVLIRSGITLLYANWEGYIGAGATAYLQFVNMQRLAYRDLTSNFIALAIRGKLQKASRSVKVELHKEVVDFLVTRLSERCQIPHKKAIRTQSNLSSTVLQEIAATLDIDYSPYATKEKLINERLLNARNTIAHGRYIELDLDDYLELHEQIVSLMETFRNQIDNAAITAAYMRQ